MFGRAAICDELTGHGSRFDHADPDPETLGDDGQGLHEPFDREIGATDPRPALLTRTSILPGSAAMSTRTVLPVTTATSAMLATLGAEHRSVPALAAQPSGTSNPTGPSSDVLPQVLLALGLGITCRPRRTCVEHCPPGRRLWPFASGSRIRRRAAALPDDCFGEVSAAVDAELVVYVREVGLHRAHRYPQVRGDRRIGPVG